jgi:hypothetical protein
MNVHDRDFVQRTIGIAAVLYILSFGQVTFAQGKQAGATPRYDELLQQAKSGSQPVDYGQLRMAYAASSDYADVDMDAVKKINSKLETKDYKKALAAADVLIKENYVSIDAHIGACFAYEGLGDKLNAQKERGIASGLIHSILSSGDGKSVASAYKVIYVREEYNVLNALGLSPQSQSLSEQNGRDYDVLRVTNARDGSIFELYFDTTISMANMEKLLKQ